MHILCIQNYNLWQFEDLFHLPLLSLLIDTCHAHPKHFVSLQVKDRKNIHEPCVWACVCYTYENLLLPWYQNIQTFFFSNWWLFFMQINILYREDNVFKDAHHTYYDVWWFWCPNLQIKMLHFDSFPSRPKVLIFFFVIFWILIIMALKKLNLIKISI